MSEQEKQAEQRGYSKGYAAGRRRLDRELESESLDQVRREFWRASLLAALPACINAQGWTSGDTPITNVKQRTALAKDFANEACRIAFGSPP